ncbi:DUF2919 family protein [Litorilituus lipolyticus]|uniref:DUF2919 family protein n=1 Tax=Litorilituus lipolyticus TaxID=2491017 RepID=A0A502L1S2_9GAMM|nr:DUF2919 family protein [Litorilituus lipolyticus]TPH16395.1 DUF2919 family protein [Litorilituus lipolyticus]
MSKEYKNYSVNDFDKFDCLKISIRVYLVLIYILRGYVVWVMSVTNMRDRVGIIQWLYPEQSLFFLSLLSGLMGLFVVLILSLRRPNAPQWVISIWPYSRVILIIALLFDYLINLLGYFQWQLFSPLWLAIQGGVVIFLIILCYSSDRININLREFPETLPEK